MLTINPIILDNFHNSDPNLPYKILEIIDKFFEIEDIGTYSEVAKDKTYEQILKVVLTKLEKTERETMLKWCDGIIADD